MGAEMEFERPRAASGLPPELRKLPPREREIAEMVYRLEAATAKQVVEKLSDPLTNAAVRSMLNRLVRKGILTRWLMRRTFIYLPALTRTDSRRIALVEFAEDHFGGSIQRAAETMQQLLHEG